MFSRDVAKWRTQFSLATKVPCSSAPLIPLQEFKQNQLKLVSSLTVYLCTLHKDISLCVTLFCYFCDAAHDNKYKQYISLPHHVSLIKNWQGSENYSTYCFVNHNWMMIKECYWLLHLIERIKCNSFITQSFMLVQSSDKTVEQVIIF